MNKKNIQIKQELLTGNKKGILNMLKCAEKLGIKYELVCKSSNNYYFKLSQANNSIYVSNDQLYRNLDKISASLAYNKDLVKKILRENGIKVPRGFQAQSLEEIKQKLFDYKIDFPLVLKPGHTGGGVGVAANIEDWDTVKEAFEQIKNVKHPNINNPVVVEEYFHARDFRILILQGKFIACTERLHPHIKGDGKSTVEELIAQWPHKLAIDWEVKRNLKKHKVKLNDILPQNKIIRLRENANGCTGGVGVSCSPDVCEKYKKIAEKCAELFDIQFAGIDIMTADIRDHRSDYRIIEINHGPHYYELHVDPDIGEPIDINTKLLKTIFNKNDVFNGYPEVKDEG